MIWWWWKASAPEEEDINDLKDRHWALGTGLTQSMGRSWGMTWDDHKPLIQPVPCNLAMQKGARWMSHSNSARVKNAMLSKLNDGSLDEARCWLCWLCWLSVSNGKQLFYGPQCSTLRTCRIWWFLFVSVLQLTRRCPFARTLPWRQVHGRWFFEVSMSFPSLRWTYIAYILQARGCLWILPCRKYNMRLLRMQRTQQAQQSLALDTVRFHPLNPTKLWTKDDRKVVQRSNKRWNLLDHLDPIQFPGLGQALDVLPRLAGAQYFSDLPPPPPPMEVDWVAVCRQTKLMQMKGRWKAETYRTWCKDV